MVLNVTAALLSRDPANAQRLSGEAIRSSVHLASRYPPTSKVGACTMRAVPGCQSAFNIDPRSACKIDPT